MYVLGGKSQRRPKERVWKHELFDSTKQGQSLFTDKANGSPFVQSMINFFSIKSKKLCNCRMQRKVEIARFFSDSNRLESRTQQNGGECKLIYHHFFHKLVFSNCIIINFILVDSTNLKVLCFFKSSVQLYWKFLRIGPCRRVTPSNRR